MHLIIITALMLSVQYSFNKQFQKLRGVDVNATMDFTLYTSVFMMVILFLMNRLRINISFFSVMCAFLNSCTTILSTYFSLKSLEKVSIALYSMFAMLGIVLMPMLYGFIFNNEQITVLKLAGCAGIVAAVIIRGTVKGISAKGISYSIAVFLIGGLGGVLSAIHQGSEYSVDSNSYLIMARMFCVIFCAVYYIMKRQYSVIRKNEFLSCLGYSASSGVGGICSLEALKILPVSVHSAAAAGGTMIFSTLISILKKEKITVQGIVSMVIACVSVVLISL